MARFLMDRILPPHHATRSILARSSYVLAVFVLALSGCTNREHQDQAPEEVAEEARENSQGGALQVIQYVTYDPSFPISADPRPPPSASIILTECVQLDIQTWSLKGTTRMDGTPSSGWIRFEAYGVETSTDIEVRLVESGPFVIEVPTAGLADLATECSLAVEAEGDWIPITAALAQPFDGVFTWDGEPGTISILGSGIVAGDPDDPHRAWAQQYWFEALLPFDRIVAIDDTLIGVPAVRLISVSADLDTPCRRITLLFDAAQVVQSQSCTPPPDVSEVVDVSAVWRSFGAVAGLVQRDSAGHHLVGAIGDWNIRIDANSEPDVVELAASLRLYDNLQARGSEFVGAPYPLTEAGFVDRVIAREFREVGRVDSDGYRFLITEGPLNPRDRSNYLSQLRIYRLHQPGRYWTAILVAGGQWNVCLGAATLGSEGTFVITADPDATVQARVDGKWSELGGDGRIRLQTGTFNPHNLRLIEHGAVTVCRGVVEIILTPDPTESDQVTTSATTPSGTTDTSFGTTDSSSP